MRQTLRIRWDPPTAMWILDDPVGSGPAGRLIVTLGGGVSMHLDRLELGRVVALEVESDADRCLSRHALGVVAAVLGEEPAGMEEGITVDREWDSLGWVAAAGLAATGEDPVRSLWRAELATALSDGPAVLRSRARRHAEASLSSLDAIAGWWDYIAEEADLVAQGQLAVWAQTVTELLDGSVPDSVSELGEMSLAPPAVEAAANDRIPTPAIDAELGLLGATRTLADGAMRYRPVDHIEASVRLIDSAEWSVDGGSIRVRTALRVAPNRGSVRCWARTVRGSTLIEQAQVVFLRGATTGIAVLGIPDGDYQVQVTMVEGSEPPSDLHRQTRVVLEAGAANADRMRSMIADGVAVGWRSLAADWEGLAIDWHGLGDERRASNARTLGEACRAFKVSHRSQMAAQYGPTTRRSRVIDAIGRSTEAIERVADHNSLSAAFLVALEGTWSSSVRRLGHALWEQLEAVDPDAATVVAVRAIAAGTAVSDDADIELIGALLDGLAGVR